MRRLIPLAMLIFAAGCYDLRPSNGGGQTTFTGERRTNPRDVLVPPGYRVEVVAQGLNMPTAVTFDADGRPCVTESGYSYGEVFTAPRLLGINDDGTTRQIAAGDHAPWTGVRFHDGAFYVAQGGVADDGGRIVRISPDGNTTVLIDKLPSLGDHHTNGPVVKDNYLYFSVGTATNSGVVGTDSADFGWLKRHPDFHDIPAKDITLAGRNYVTKDPLHPGQTAETGAYAPFGTRTEANQVIKGQLPATGCILRIPLQQATSNTPPAKPELVAWGLRNPFGLSLAPDGSLYATENQFDDRGSRPVWGTGDLLWRIGQPGLWYGWPDFFAGHPIDDKERFGPPHGPKPERLLAKYPNVPPKPAAVLGVHASADGLDFSRSDAFGYPSQAFIAEFGDMAPNVGKTLDPVGFQVVRVDPNTGVVHSFMANKGDQNAPATWLKRAGLERPVDAKFSPDGHALYVVDFGIMTVAKKPHNRQNTGVLWRITREEASR